MITPDDKKFAEMHTMLSSNHPEMLRAAVEMSNHIRRLPTTDNDDRGVLELECSLGMAPNEGKRVGAGWRPTLHPMEARILLTALEQGEAKWTSIDAEWRLVYDTYLRLPDTEDGSRNLVRVRSIDGQSEKNITKTLLGRIDFICPPPCELRLRFQAKLEREVQPEVRHSVLLLPPESVRVSLRRSFEVKSEKMKGVCYRFTVVKAWTGRTAKEAEIVMHNDEDQDLGENSIEVEVELDWPSKSPERLLYSCLGVLVKTQDLVELISGVRELRKTSMVKLDDMGKTVRLRPLSKKDVKTQASGYKRKRQ